MFKKIKVTMIIIVLLRFTVLAQEYNLSLDKEIILFSSGSLFLAGSEILDEVSGFQRPIGDINRMDRFFMQPYSEEMDLAGTVTSCLALGSPGILTLISNGDPDRILTYGTMYGEALLLTWGVKDLIKAGVSRWRPYTYFNSEKEEDDDYMNSFPSGHTSLAFMGATFLTTILSSDFEDSPFSRSLSMGAYSIAVLSGVLRVASGEHYITDVLAGAVLGTFVGWLIPSLHRVNTTSDSQSQLVINPAQITFSFSY